MTGYLYGVSCYPVPVNSGGILFQAIVIQVICCRSSTTCNYSDLALFVFLLLSFIMRKTQAYELMQNNAVMPVYSLVSQILTRIV
jgi:hypothetical protein